MANTVQLKKDGQIVYPITDRACIIGLGEGPVMECIYAWEGQGTPDITKIPAGVTVNYNDTDYTGTLLASSSTSGYQYLVYNTTSTEYDRYATDATGGSYSWKPMGDTTIQSPDIADNLTTNDSTKALSAKQGKILNEEVEGLEHKVDDLDIEVNAIYREDAISKNEYPELVGTAGFCDLSGSITGGGTTYFYTQKLAVNPGDVVSCNFQMRFITAYAGNTAKSDKGDTYKTTYTVPEGIDSVIVTVTRNVTDVNATRLNISGIVYRPTTMIDPIQCTWTTKIKQLNATTYLDVVANCHNKKGARYVAFFTMGSGSFTSDKYVTFGKGRSENYSSYIKVGYDSVTVYNNGNEALTYSHGLTIADYLYIEILVGQYANQRVNIRICTNGGEHYRNDLDAGLAFTNSVGTVSFYSTIRTYNVVCSYCVTDLQKEVIVFGDSYISLQDPNRWPDVLLLRNLSGFALSGFSGATSAQEILSFRTISKMRMPSTVIWAIGMNDIDNEDSINSSWKTCVEEVMEFCKANGNELILCTIPNTPERRHTYKNAYVRASGYRFIDFARSVGADTYPSGWYTGMLSNDNTHPALQGAVCLASAVMSVVPKIAIREIVQQ